MMLVPFIGLCLIRQISTVSRSSDANFEGDMHLTPDQLRVMSGESNSLMNVRFGFLDPIKHWPDGHVRYDISNDLREYHRFITNAVAKIESPCLTFGVRLPNDTDYLLFKKSDNGCSAPLGYRRGVQEVKIEIAKCLGYDKVIHLVLHAVGLLHMHNSPTRYYYIYIHWENIKREDWVHFNIYSDVVASLYGTDYDYESIMHYPKDAYSKNGKISIYAYNNMTDVIGRERKNLSPGDRLRIDRMYQCY